MSCTLQAGLGGEQLLQAFLFALIQKLWINVGQLFLKPTTERYCPGPQWLSPDVIPLLLNPLQAFHTQKWLKKTHIKLLPTFLKLFLHLTFCKTTREGKACRQLFPPARMAQFLSASCSSAHCSPKSTQCFLLPSFSGIAGQRVMKGQDCN